MADDSAVTTEVPKVLLKKGMIVNADGTFEGDVLLDGGIIVAIGEDIPQKGDEVVIECRGMYIMPGGIDPHTHFDFEFMGTRTVDDFYSGTVAALAGGTTMIIDFIIPRIGESLLKAYDRYVEKAQGNAVCDYAFHMAITWWGEQITLDMARIVAEKKINSFKMFMAYKDMLMLNDSELYQSFLKCKSIGALAMVHAENGSVIAENAKILIANGITGPEGHDLSRPEDVEAEATNRACVIANQVGCPLYVVHVMTEAAAKVIAEYREEGRVIFGETLSAAVGSDGAPKSCSFKVGAAHLMSPPISHDPENKVKIMKRLAKGELSCTGSDNCTFTTEQKEKMGKGDFTKIPNGVNGVEDRMGVVWQKGVNEKLLSLSQFVAVTSTNTAKIFNIYPKKGVIAVGSDADVVVWNPYKLRQVSSTTHKQACDFNIFEGMKIMGAPEHVLVRGTFCMKYSELSTIKGYGQYVPTPAYSPECYKL